MRAGTKHSAESRLKIGKASEGRKHSAESKARISKANKGKKFTKEHRYKISLSNKGKNKGKRHPRWKGGRKIHSRGYIHILTALGYVAEHRLVMEKYLGKRLKKKEVVHHINNKLDDNRLENLMLFPNQKAHTKYHHERRRNGTKNS